MESPISLKRGLGASPPESTITTNDTGKPGVHAAKNSGAWLARSLNPKGGFAPFGNPLQNPEQ